MSDQSNPDLFVSLRNGIITIGVTENNIKARARLSVDETEELIRRLEDYCYKATQEEKEPLN
jgi:hypothetical protein